jgi:hypothetical protein
VTLTYEDLLADIGILARPREAGERKVFWLPGAKDLGVSRTPEGRLEIFLVGPKLATSRPGLKDALEFGGWFREQSDTESFEANRLILPAMGYFDQVATFLCIELLRNGAESDIASAFKRSEPIIDLVIERLRLSDGALLGLFGEMLVLDALTQRARDDEVAEIVENWSGWKQSLRDFSFGTVGVEVKTTTRNTSTHEIQGVHQIELNDGLSGGPVETSLLLVSISVNYTAGHENAVTLRDLVDRICGRLEQISREDARTIFLSRVREYGAESGFGYNHTTMAQDPAVLRPIEVLFVRGYNMADPNVSVLRRADIVRHQHVDLGSLKYTVDLPGKVSGDLNPATGLQQVAKLILGE